MGGDADRLRRKEKQGWAQEDGCTLTQAQKQTHQDVWAVVVWLGSRVPQVLMAWQPQGYL